jgi:hypothetical protein
MARAVSVNIGTPHPLGLRRGRTVRSAIAKAAVEGLAGEPERRLVGGPCASRASTSPATTRPTAASTAAPTRRSNAYAADETA